LSSALARSRLRSQPGKSLYTTVRELVENSLDACESLRVLPDIELSITELSAASFAALRGVDSSARADQGLYEDSRKSLSKKKKKAAGKKVAAGAGSESEPESGAGAAASAAAAAEEDEPLDKGAAASSSEQFFRLSCRDNGCGMKHAQVPDMFGRVLSGSKYGVKQARGKFGLGAKMALIWSKKSTGLPIEVTTAHTVDREQLPTSETFCRLDIDINKNEPKVYVHSRRALGAGEQWHGSKVELVIRGDWQTYKRWVVAYMQQLAVITPYARFLLRFASERQPKQSFTTEYARRSEQLCALATEVKHHPKSVDNIMVRQLLHGLAHPERTSLPRFLAHEFSAVSPALAERLAVELGSVSKGRLGPHTTCAALSDENVHQIAQLLRDTTAFPDPDADCLSPAGEYNLRLGIMKEIEPELVATASSKPGVHAGHPFLVEAAVAIGGKDANKPGISVYRFANRIPLLFEPGADVVSLVANKTFKWATYMINPKDCKVSVFVSIVSTKVPFKGTGKEYIGANIEPIKLAVTEAMRACAVQLKRKVLERRAAGEREGRLRSLQRYIPDVARALSTLAQQMRDNKDKQWPDADADDVPGADKRDYLAALAELERGIGMPVAEPMLKRHLEDAVTAADMQDAQELVRKRGRGQAAAIGFFIVPGLCPAAAMAKPVLDHSVLALRLFARAEQRQDAPARSPMP
jgi:DNA topoisomerase-6 subunit B